MLEFRADPANKKAFVSLDRIKHNTNFGIERFWFFLGKDLKAEADRAILKKPRGGRTYISRDRAGRKRRHVASQPGESPANRSGAYRKSIGFVVHGHKSMDFGAGTDYAPHLENGTSRMKPRPGLFNAIKNTERNGVKLAAQQVKGALT